MRFTAATAEDKAEILALYRSLAGTEYCAWTDEYPGEAEIEGDLSRNALFCMKDGNGKIAGTISIDKDEEVEKLPCWREALQPGGELSRLGVDREYQNQGLARRLLQHGMDELRRRGFQSVHFLVCKTNRKAIRSYDKLGFDIVGECRLFGEDWWCYEKSLNG
ncbi:MAG TPA: N-acetyltransferase [Lachnospiraceae bacterium]|nr:N-acetyltransferase [Lachnospiraceae bacterium]